MCDSKIHVSVIIPAFNASKTLARALNSVLNQTFSKRLEIIFVDDGSTDETLSIAKDFKSRFEGSLIVIGQKNQGAAAARNRAMNVANGEYIAFLDADDAWHPQKLEVCLDAMLMQDLVIIGHDYVLNNNFQDKFDIVTSQKKIRKISLWKQLIKNFSVTPGILFKREHGQNFDNEMRYCEDYELWTRMALQYPLYYIDLPLVMLDRKPLTVGGLSSNRYKMRLNEIYMYFKISKRFPLLYFALPLLISISVLKHIKREIQIRL